jgi:hypothetical protein
MTIRSEVRELIQMGPFPAATKDSDEHDIDRRGAALNRIARPVNDEEAAALLACFGPDEAFGLAWALLHLIETAPGGCPIKEKPDEYDNEWIRRLWDRSHRSF